jgi:RHS repeat-associated protein
VTAANTISLAYTAANRLQTASGNWGASSFSYDGVGNRLNDNNTVSSVTTTRLASYPATSNRMSAITQNAATFKSFIYDGNSNITTEVRPGETFVTSYNKRNRPVSVTRNAVAYATYGYNALNQLTSRSTSAAGGPTGTVQYIYDLDGHLIAEADAATGATARDYIWLAANDNTPIDLPLAVAEGATLYQVHTDHLGRPIRMTDSAKATVWQATYKPWGEVQTTSGTKALNLRFPGQVFQIETAYHYNWHRHYDPTTGRYTQPDPLRFVDGPSVYAYAGSSPFVKTDREGLHPKSTPWGGYDGPILGGDGFIHLPTTQTWTPWDDQISKIWGMCKRAFGGGGGDDEDCSIRLAAEQGRCYDRRWQMAHPDYFRGCMDRAMERYQKCKKGDSDEPDEWGDDDEETGFDQGR